MFCHWCNFVDALLFCEVLGSHSGTAEESSLPWFDTLAGCVIPSAGMNCVVCVFRL